MRGIYAVELSTALQQMVEAFRLRPPRVFVDLDCADGYYAVGVARSAPAVTVHAFDPAASALAAMRTLAEANGVRGPNRMSSGVG